MTWLIFLHVDVLVYAYKKVRSDMICFSNFLFVNHGRFKSWRTLPPFVIFSNYFLKGTLSKICQIPCGGIKTLKNFTVDQLCSNKSVKLIMKDQEKIENCFIFNVQYFLFWSLPRRYWWNCIYVQTFMA